SSEGKIRFEGIFFQELTTAHYPGKGYWLDNEIKAYGLSHELAHIYSCIPFYGNFKENSLLIHFDGGASKSNFSAWKYKNNEIQLLEYHWDLKYLSSFFNSNALIFSILSGNFKNQHSIPGKFMGYAAYGKYSSKIERWLKTNDYFNSWGNKKLFFEKVNTDWNIQIKSFDLNNGFIKNVASTFHYIFIRETVKIINQLHEKFNTDYLYFTGGSALNIALNSALIKNSQFKNVFIPPCTNDSGLAIGAGAYLETIKGNKIKNHNAFLNNFKIEDKVEYTFNEIEKLADLLVNNKIIGVCNGYGEAGPRALGNRSILSLANSKELASKVSQQIKNREWYRPLAPVMLEANTKLYTGMAEIHHLSKYMLLEFQILDKFKEELEGVVHENGTARIQTLFKKEDNPFLFDLLNYLDNKYGIKALINTSFNGNNEPMVHTFYDAENSMKKMNLDGLVFNGKLINI
ncbi:carbamoyltransferase C-terminal domain-containing protein, partial [Bacteroidota bacterium]